MMTMPSPAVPDVTDALVALRRWLLDILPQGTIVMQARQNGVTAPVTPFLLMSPMSTSLLSRPSRRVMEQTLTETIMARLDIRLSAFGEGAASMCQRASFEWCAPATLTRFRQMHPAITPLLTLGAESILHTDAGLRYLPCWQTQLAMQLNQTLTVPVETATSVTIVTNEIPRAE